jgi:hypothetical protein
MYDSVNGTPKKLKVEKAQQKVKISKKIDDQSMKIMKELKDLEDMTKIPYRLDYVLSTYWADKVCILVLVSQIYIQFSVMITFFL